MQFCSFILKLSIFVSCNFQYLFSKGVQCRAEARRSQVLVDVVTLLQSYGRTLYKLVGKIVLDTHLANLLKLCLKPIEMRLFFLED